MPSGSQIITDAMLNRNNDILIIDIGYNGGYDDLEELISQIDMMIYHNNSRKYIVLGRVDHKKVYNELEDQLLKRYGDRFVNLREYYIKTCLELQGLELTKEDSLDISSGVAPGALFFDVVHENYYGYFSKARCVFNKLKELGYI